MEEGTIRGLEQIRETDPESRNSRTVTLAFVAMGGACIVLSIMALSGRKSKDVAGKVDPLSELVAQRTKGPKATELAPRDVTFPGILSDKDKPTTALAALRGAASAEATIPAPMPPPATDRLPVVPLPMQNVLEATPVVTRPRDGLTKAAADVAQVNATPEPGAPEGHEGGFQLQVSSFKTQGEAQAFSDQLRGRGHKAYVREAMVPGRGKWYRVRVGPFATQQQAMNYRTSFEAKEHVVPFVVPKEEGKADPAH